MLARLAVFTRRLHPGGGRSGLRRRPGRAGPAGGPVAGGAGRRRRGAALPAARVGGRVLPGAARPTPTSGTGAARRLLHRTLAERADPAAARRRAAASGWPGWTPRRRTCASALAHGGGLRLAQRADLVLVPARPAHRGAARALAADRRPGRRRPGRRPGGSASRCCRATPVAPDEIRAALAPTPTAGPPGSWPTR